VELRDHPWFVASQFHPEFKSRPERPHPLFDGFVKAALEDSTAREKHAAPTSAPSGRAEHPEPVEPGVVGSPDPAPETSTVSSAG
jgi:hypothetical protein